MSPLARFEHADWSLVPDHLHHQIERWHSDGAMPKSGFLTDVLCNDLVGAVRDGNPMERASLVGVVLFLIGEGDPQSYGSLDKCEAWHDMRGARGVREITDRRMGEIYENPWRGRLWKAGDGDDYD